jgi:hypothetical protein
MRIVFILLQLMATLRHSFVLSALATGLLGLSIWQWTHAMYEWQDYRDGFRPYVSRAASDEMTADIDAQVQAIMEQCGIRVEFQAEKSDSRYRETKLAECKQNIASYRRVAVTRTAGQVVVKAKVKCRCESSR